MFQSNHIISGGKKIIKNIPNERFAAKLILTACADYQQHQPPSSGQHQWESESDRKEEEGSHSSSNPDTIINNSSFKDNAMKLHMYLTNIRALGTAPEHHLLHTYVIFN